MALGETWKPINGHEHRYEVSDCGRVRSLKSNWCKILKQYPAKRRGYMTVTLWDRANKKKDFRYVHRLVLETFCGCCPEGQEACHNDGDKRNNKLSNLRWDTKSENVKDLYRHGKEIHGERAPNGRLRAGEALAIKQLAESGLYKLRDIAKQYGVSVPTVSAIKVGRLWDKELKEKGLL